MALSAALTPRPGRRNIWFTRVDRATDGSLSGEAKLCDIGFLGDYAPVYQALHGTADANKHIALDVAK
jgi:hypothetical protein